jgi:4-hydroxybenzoate polyprenyltransferase
MKKRSEFGKIKGVDLLNALYHGLAAVSIPFVGYLSQGKMPDLKDGYLLLSVFLGAVFADIFKRTATNSNGEAFKKEK